MALLFLPLPDEVSMAKTVELLRKHQNNKDGNAALFDNYYAESTSAVKQRRYL